jgi:hypothetical protein
MMLVGEAIPLIPTPKLIPAISEAFPKLLRTVVDYDALLLSIVARSATATTACSIAAAGKLL